MDSVNDDRSVREDERMTALLDENSRSSGSEELEDEDIEENFTNNSMRRSFNDFNFVLANARSLRPKLYSLIDTLEEIDGHMAVITETWFKSTPQLEQILRDAEDVTGYAFVRKDREQNDNNARGGGVAVVYKKSNLETTELKVKGNHEIVATLSRRTGQRRKIVAIGAYIAPAADAEESKDFLETISDAIRTFKNKYCAPYFIIAGNFNKRKIAVELREFTDIKLVRTGPTRGKNTLDLVFTNFPEFIKEFGTLPALFNADGVMSDHDAVHLLARIPRVPDYKIDKYSYIKQTAEGDKKMTEQLSKVDWTRVTGQRHVDLMVDNLHQIFNSASNSSYKTVTTTRKSNQPPWIDDYVLALIKQRRKVFRRERRSDEWKKIKKKTRAVIKKRKAFFNKQ